MAYKSDCDLEFLAGLSDDELQPLFESLVYDADGTKRRTENITGNEEYKKNEPHHSRYWKLIAGELQHFGGNTIANVIRGGGVSYHEILVDVASKYIKDYLKKNPGASTSDIEVNLVKHLLTEYRGQILKELEDVKKQAGGCDSDDIRDLIRDLEKNTTGFMAAGVLAYMVAGRVIPKIGLRLITGLVATSALRAVGIRAGVSVLAGRAGSLIFGPVGWTVSGLWLLADVAGPAYRVTIPCVIQIAFLRLRHSCMSGESGCCDRS